MSGPVVIEGGSDQAAGATGRGGTLVIKGSASARCGISMKGVDMVVHGSIGHAGAFMAQKGALVVCGDTGPDLGRLHLRGPPLRAGEIAGLGADCVEKEVRDDMRRAGGAAGQGEADAEPSEFRRYGSARRLYNFQIDDASDY